MKRVTINDIAKACHTSKATVSYVINERYNKVSEEMVEKVQQTIKELGYVPSLNAKSLAGSGSNLIGVIIAQKDGDEKLIADNPFYSEFLSGIEYYLRKKGYGVVLSVVTKNHRLEELVKKWNLDGAVILGIENDQMLKRLGEYEFPMLLIDSYMMDPRYYRMNLRDEEACYEAARYLLREEGHIALVTGQINKSRLLEQRVSGYRRALKETGMEVDEDLIFQGDITYEYGRMAAAEILKHQEVTKVLVTADVVAGGVINYFQSVGIRVPEDREVMGFDNTYQSRNIYPRLTTVGQNISGRGEMAGELILKIIGHEEVPKEIYSDFQIIEGDTTK